MEEIYGISLEALADITTKHGELNAQFGQEQGHGELQRYLASRGLNEQAWSAAHNAWLERFRADPSGMLEAQLHQLLSQQSLKAHFGDVADMSQDQLEGVTLDTYAKLCVAMGKPGVDAEAVAREHGLQGVAQWTAANAAWAGKMSQDTTHKLTTQFGTLYQKYAGPAFAEQQLQQTAAILAESSAPRPSAEPSKQKDLSQANLLRELRSGTTLERWTAARWLAHQWKAGDPSTAVNLECIPVLREILERHDEHTVSNAEDAVGKLTRDLGQFTEETKFSLSLCLTRAREKLQSVEAAFAPIRDKAVPERIPLQSRIQDYTSLVRTLESTLRDWPLPKAAGAALAVAGGGVALARPAAPKPSTTTKGFPMGLLALPVVALVVGGVLWKTHSASKAPETATSAAAAAPASNPTPPAEAAKATPAAKAPENAPAAPPAKAGKKKH